MYHYRLYCLDILSDLEFMQLPKGSGTPENIETAITIIEGKMPKEYIFDKRGYSLIREKDSYLSNYVCFLHIKDNNTIVYERKPSEHPEYLQNYILGWGMAMILHQRQRAVIHCSAVYDEKGAILISGRSGCGKSTMTSNLLENGFSFMADDTSAILIQNLEAFATPCYPYRKLCRDVVAEKCLNEDELIYIDEDKDKFLVPYKETFTNTPKKIRALILLEPVKAIEEGLHTPVNTIEIAGIQKVYCLRKSLFLDRLYKESNNDAYLFNMCLELAGKIPMYIITRPTDRDSREEVFNSIIELTKKI